jgi:hypothetical protein
MRRSRQPRKTPHIQRYNATKTAGRWRRPEKGAGAMNKLPGLYPWLGFEVMTRD